MGCGALPPTTPAPTEHKSTEEIYKAVYQQDKFELPVAQLDTNPLSHKSAKGKRGSPSIRTQLESTRTPQVSAGLTCMCMNTTTKTVAK